MGIFMSSELPLGGAVRNQGSYGWAMRADVAGAKADDE